MTSLFDIQLGPFSWAPSVVSAAVLAALLALTFITIHRARRRLAAASRWRRFAVTLLNLVALLAVAALLAPPQGSRPVTAQVTLLTEGAGAAATADAFALGASAEGAQALHTAGQLRLRRPDLDTLEVLGHGIDAAQWATLPPTLRVSWTPPAEPLVGPIDVRWPAVIEAGQALAVTGALLLGEEDQVAELRLLDPAGIPVASVSARSGQSFGLAATPRATGALTYRLQAVRGDVVFADEPVTTWVREPAGARLLVRQSAPSFESRQLANWAADRGNPLVIHSRISRDRDLVQGLNLPEDAALEFSPTLLTQTDLAVLDGRRWASLPDSERALLLDAVRAGLGLLLLVDAELVTWLDAPENTALTGVRLSPDGDAEPRWPRWRDSAPEQPLPVAPWRLDPTTAHTLTSDEQGAVLESWQALGMGRIVVSRLRERHRWATGGDNDVFARYWARMLRSVGRAGVAERWLAPPADERLRPGQRATVCTAGVNAHALRLLPVAVPSRGAMDPLALLPHASGAPLRCGHAWPAEAGWHRLQLLDDDAVTRDEIWLYVFGPDAWTADRLAHRQSVTRSRTESLREASTPSRVAQPLSPWWAWCLLLVTGGSLWLERRLHDLG